MSRSIRCLPTDSSERDLAHRHGGLNTIASDCDVAAALASLQWLADIAVRRVQAGDDEGRARRGAARDGIGWTAATMAGIGRTYQNIRLFASNTVLENVTVAQNSLAAMGGLQSVFLPASARERALKEEARRLLDLMGLWGKRDYLSGALSYGEQRRLEIARACALRPRLLLLDEPAAGMNSTETDALWGRVEDLRRDGLCVLLVEHDMNLVMRRCDYVFVLNFGELIAAGSPAEIQGDKAVIEAYLGEEDD